MTASVTVSRTGIGLGTVARRIQMERIMRPAALLHERLSKQYSPIDTGRLRASIHTEQLGPIVFKVFTNVYYAIYQEYGTKKMKAHPFFRPATAMIRKMLGPLARVEIKNAVGG